MSYAKIVLVKRLLKYMGKVKISREFIEIAGKQVCFYTFSKPLSNSVFLICENGEARTVSKKSLMALKNNQLSAKTGNTWNNLFLKKTFTKNVCPTFFIIELTNNCNLRCKYCFRGEHTLREMSIEVLEKIVDQISNHVKDNKINSFTIQPWGGEPLLKVNLIIKIRELFLQRGLYPTISCETNGLLLTDKVLDALISNNISFGISIDGCTLVNDFHRPFANGKGATSFLEKRINDIKAKYPLMNLSCISVNDALSLKHIKESLDYLVNSLKFRSIKMNLFKDNAFANSEIKKMDFEEIEKFYSCIFKHWLKTPNYSEGNISARIKNLLTDETGDICLSRGCRGGYSMIAYDVDGCIYNCELIGNKGQKLGTINDNIINIVKKSIAKNNPYFRDKKKDECDYCPWYCYCQGGCSSNCLNNKTVVDEEMCIINKTLYPLIIEAILNRSKKILQYIQK